MKFLAVAREWGRGFASLVYHQQRDWDQQIIGVNYYRDGDKIYKDANDGLLSAATQAPSFFSKSDNIERRVRADGANHLEETTHPNVRERLSEVFRNKEVNVPEKNAGGNALKVQINGPIYANDGQKITFSAKISNAKGSVRYQWYHRQEPYSNWVAKGGNSPDYAHTFHSGPGGETAHSAIKLKVSSAGEVATDVHSVDVYGCDNSARGLVDTNVIIPCN